MIVKGQRKAVRQELSRRREGRGAQLPESQTNTGSGVKQASQQQDGRTIAEQRKADGQSPGQAVQSQEFCKGAERGQSGQENRLILMEKWMAYLCLFMHKTSRSRTLIPTM